MRASAENIWSVPAYLPYLQPPLNSKSVAAAERTLGYKLPGEYLALLRKQNGGYIRFSLRNSPHRRICGIGPLFPSLLNVDWREAQEYVPFKLDGLIPFDGDGHWHLCLDYRKSRSHPSITYADVECAHQKKVASSFGEYLHKLRFSVEDELFLPSVSDIDEVVNQLTRKLRRKVLRDEWAYGYLCYRFSLGTAQDPEWLWIAPNCVTRGFVRPNDARFNELKDLMQDKADRFPNLPPRSYIVTVTKGARAKSLNAFAQLGLSLSSLRDAILDE
jgi:hypothetical protein